ncbi:MAG: EscU/YscU/HrcU family type III secretion system export apparatus switch protein [Fimbriimonadales bacterium]|nr:EscU/YscU/HrcU family type III secretion system export apparatus switch protein [Fimbriimonadales bacterium]
MPEETAQERTEQPTPRKRRRARRRGTVARSADISSSLSLFAFALLAPLLGGILSAGLYPTL